MSGIGEVNWGFSADQRVTELTKRVEVIERRLNSNKIPDLIADIAVDAAAGEVETFCEALIKMLSVYHEARTAAKESGK